MFRFDPYSPAVDADPFPFYKTLRDEHPCFWSEEANMWVLSRYDDIVTALNDWETYSSAKGNLMDEMPNRAGNTLGTTDPPRHDRLRSIVQFAFTKKAVEGLTEPVRASANRALDAVQGERTFDFVSDVSSKVTVDVLFGLFNLPRENERMVRDKAVLMVQSDPRTRQKGPEHLAAFQWMSEYAKELVELRKREPGDDLITALIQAEVAGEKLADREVQMTITTLIMAGIESLSGFLAMFALNLADHADARRRLAANPALIPDAIEESLRFNTSAQRFRRCLQKDVELHGQTMRAGDFVCLAYGSGNRDERRFANAHLYDIDRKPKGHLGFGGGVHACLGTAFARLAARVACEEFLKRVPEFVRVQDQLPWMPSTTFRSPTRLELAVG
ncbi:cytochrome P450 [Azospirillum sp. YIM DDC1]|uniref:Cytochrome P450 n=3 Tax=Azospirillum TaxID=191 RepID=A0A9P1JZI3_9PROT|nr:MULTISPECIES: cytochrome P450 [Azospirillum]MBK3774158.1 cytochrome P450 [Azospirillum brasilense]AIB15700.1 cytochrome P450 [Azospirillum argentinense]AWJ92738.1 cytochrome P450 [Azospirillum baldaniorum]EZQ03664.1 cytochrome P450 [Azospirillum argentinense]MBK3798935.1 cytochrome P450 [Azospirillum argentinense]